MGMLYPWPAVPSNQAAGPTAACAVHSHIPYAHSLSLVCVPVWLKVPLSLLHMGQTDSSTVLGRRHGMLVT